MSEQTFFCKTHAALILIAAMIFGAFPWQGLYAGQAGSSTLPIDEDFEGPLLDPGLHVAGRPAPSVSGDAAITEDFGLRYPCLKGNGDDPVIIVHPTPIQTNSIDAGFALLQDCFDDGASFTLVGLFLQDQGAPRLIAGVYLKRQGDTFFVSTSVTTDDARSIGSSWLPLDAAATFGEPMWLELVWAAAQGAGTQNGSLKLVIRRSDGSQSVAIDLSGIDNDSHLLSRIEIGVREAQGLTGAPAAMSIDDLLITP